MEKYTVVGSGPAGMAAAFALPQPHLVDSGLRLDSHQADQAARLGASAHAEWGQQDLDWLQSSMVPSSRGVAAKLYFGSDVAYQRSVGGKSWDIEAGYEPSLALGGLSTVWGSSVLPAWEKEIKEWPFSVETWGPHYRAVLRETGLAGVQDSLDEMLPLHHPEPENLAESNQAKKIRQRMDRHGAALRESGFRWGRSRLLVRARERGGEVNRLSYHPDSPPSHAQSCVRCGMCMYGCPYDLIYTSRKSVLSWAQIGKIRYQNGVVVEGFRERSDRVEVWGRQLESGQGWRQETQRLFLAAGTLSSTALVLASSHSPTKTARFLDSQYFTLPLLLLDSVSKVRKEALHTLAQLFLEILPGEISARLIHLQIYTYNDMMSRFLGQKLGPFREAFPFLKGRLEGRLAFLQGYLHSDDSGTMEMTVSESADGTGRVSVSAQTRPRTRPVIDAVVRKLCRHGFQTGFLPFWPMLQVGVPGRGFHSGGSLPMRSAAQEKETGTDLLGRPFGLKRVHVVDASVFPSIPATTITLTAMANAHRIATEATQLDA